MRWFGLVQYAEGRISHVQAELADVWAKSGLPGRTWRLSTRSPSAGPGWAELPLPRPYLRLGRGLQPPTGPLHPRADPRPGLPELPPGRAASEPGLPRIGPRLGRPRPHPRPRHIRSRPTFLLLGRASSSPGRATTPPGRSSLGLGRRRPSLPPRLGSLQAEVHQAEASLSDAPCSWVATLARARPNLQAS